MDLEAYDELVEAIYEAPFEDLGWHQVVSKLLEVFHSTIAVAAFCETQSHSSGESHRPHIHDSSTHRTQHREIHLYDNLSRHIRKAAHLGRQVERLSSTNSVFADVLDQLRLGIVLLDQDAQILNMNAYARRLIEQNNELSEKASRLEFCQTQPRGIFHQALRRGAISGTSSSFSLSRRDRTPLCLCLVPCREITGLKAQPTGTLTLFVSDPDDRQTVDSAALAKRWNLTALEGEVVLLMIKGLTLKQIAARLELTENTSRWYSKQIMSKVGVRRQAELNARLMKDIAFMVDMG